jgi:hypothetical protein
MTDFDDASIKTSGALLRLGSRLADLLDADQWNNIEPLLFECDKENKNMAMALKAARLVLMGRDYGYFACRISSGECACKPGQRRKCSRSSWVETPICRGETTDDGS